MQKIVGFVDLRYRIDVVDIPKLVCILNFAKIMKNNRPRYLLIDFSQAQEMATASDEDVLSISKRLISKNRVAYDELAK